MTKMSSSIPLQQKSIWTGFSGHVPSEANTQIQLLFHLNLNATNKLIIFLTAKGTFWIPRPQMLLTSHLVLLLILMNICFLLKGKGENYCASSVTKSNRTNNYICTFGRLFCIITKLSQILNQILNSHLSGWEWFFKTGRRVTF